MKRITVHAAVAVPSIAAGTVLGWQSRAANYLVQFPEKYKGGVHYTTVNRGGVREEIFTTPEAIEAARAASRCQAAL